MRANSNLLDAGFDGGSDHRQHFFVTHDTIVRFLADAIFGHAINAAIVTAVSYRYSQILEHDVI